MKKLNLQIKGMTCSSCEVIIERAMKKVPGVQNVQVSRAKEKAYIHCDETVKVEDLQAAVADKGYKILSEEQSDPPQLPPSPGFIVKNKRRYAEIGAVLVFIIGAYFILQQLNLLPQSLGITNNMSYGFVFLIGLVAATSTCLAVAGGLLLAVANKYTQAHPHLTASQRFQPHIYFNVGRIVSYTLLGGLIGLLGSVITLSPQITGIIIIAASILMIVMGVQLLQLFPWMNKIQLKMPKFIAHKLYDASHQSNGSTGKTSSFLFGAATFFLPCGFTQALQLYVLGRGDFTTGALTMLAFSLGTLPSLIGIGAFSSFAKGSLRHHFMTFSAVLIIILGLFNIPNGLALTGAVIGLPDSQTADFPDAASTVDPGQLQNVQLVDGKQVAEMNVFSLDYSPPQFTVLQGVPVEWRIDGRNAVGCAQVISVPSLGITEYLPRDQVKIINFIPDKIGKIKFSCTMGMAGPGVFTVIPSENSVPINTLGNTPSTEEAVPAIDNSCNPEIMNCNIQKISMEVSREKGFYPNTHVLQKGVPVEMEIDTKIQLGGCMSTLVIPEYGVAHFLEKGKTTLRFTPTTTGTIPFTCSMGSKMGEFIVT